MERNEYRSKARLEFGRRLHRCLDTSLFEQALWKLSMWAPFGGQYVHNEQNGGYLLRTYLVPSRKQMTWLPGVYLHYFIRSDSDRSPHNHPWASAVSLILLGGYTERRCRVTKSFKRRLFKNGDVVPQESMIWSSSRFRPLSINRLWANTFHRIDLTDKDKGCWSLFFSGERLQPSDGTDWGFLDYETGVFTPWGKHLEKT